MAGPWEKYQAAAAAADGPWAKYSANSAQPDSASGIPLSGAERQFIAQQPTSAPTQAPADPSLVDRIVGGGETALALATGATSGMAGLAGGAIAGIGKSIVDGTFGTQQGVQTTEQAAADGMGKYTYAPRTAEGQRQTEAVGNVLEKTIPITPLTAEVGALGQAAGHVAEAARNAAPAAGAAAVDAATTAAGAVKGAAATAKESVVGAAKAGAGKALETIRAASPAIADRVERTLARTPEPTPKTAGASVGSAGADVVQQRIQTAEGLPVPIDLTEGQATRDHTQTMFERETSKLPEGDKLRERYADQNEQIPQNFDAWIDQTGAKAYGARAVGESVVGAIEQKAAQDKARIRVAYKEAEKAGEMAAPVSLDNVVSYLNDAAPDAETAPILNAIRKHVIKLGIAEDNGGVLVPTQGETPAFSGLMNTPAAKPGVTLNTAETLRQAINRATDYEPTNIRHATIIKGLIDSATDGAGGELYQAARRLRENYAKQYEDRAVIARLLNNKRGMADRQVALEDVFQNTILKGSLDDRRHLRRVLLAQDQNTSPELRAAGQQAWSDLQGALLRHLKDDSLKNVATNTRGKPIFSAAKLNDNIRKLDEDGTLTLVLGKKGAENVRDINDLSKLVFTAPPGSFNTSGTTATLLAALGESAVNGHLIGLPVPLLTTLRFMAKQHRKFQLMKKIDAALARSRTADLAPTTTTQPPARPAGVTLH